jgi:serine/threonine protein kinase
LSVPARKIGKYEIVERLGRGGMAEVYRAYQSSLDRYVAIKVLHAFLADDPEFKQRFEREAQNIAKLKHPNIVQVYDFDFDGDGESYYMVMELIDGMTLKDRFVRLAEQGELLPLAEVLRIIKEAAGALAYAHSRSMIHRDVKPANLMLDHDHRLVLTDFGIAKIVTGAQFTASGGMVGTPAYMAPEQGLGEAGDERSDLYSLGIILFQLLTGKLPYDAETPLAIVLKHLNSPTPLVRDVNPALPEQLDRIVNKAIAKEAINRYQTANDLIDDLRQLEEQLGIVSERPKTGEYNAVLYEKAVQPAMTMSTVSDTTPLVMSEAALQELSHKPNPMNWLIGAGVVALGVIILGFASGLIRLPSNEQMVASPSAIVTEVAAASEVATVEETAEVVIITATSAPSLTPTITPTSSRTPVTPTATATSAPTSTATETATVPSPTVAVVTPIALVRANVLMRSGPSDQYARVERVIAGDELIVLGRNADNLWLQVMTASGAIGWIPVLAVETSVDGSVLTVVPVASITPTITPSSTVTLTRTPRPTATSTITPSPTIDVTQTISALTPNATMMAATDVACNWSYAVRDVVLVEANGRYGEVDDRYQIEAGTDFILEVILFNDSDCAWETNTNFVFTSGEDFDMGRVIFLQDAPTLPGQDGRFEFRGRTPCDGSDVLTGEWQLRTPRNTAIGDVFQLNVQVFGATC